MMTRIFTIMILALSALVSLPRAGSAADISLTVAPEIVEITTFYNGSTVEVKGSVAAGAEVLLRVSGAGEELHVKKKGKVGGLLWMNTGDLTFENAPAVYMLYSSNTFKGSIENNAIGLGYNALENQIEILPSSDKDSFYFKEFVKLKEKQDLYSKNFEAVTYGPAADGSRPYQAQLTISPRMKQGLYTVEAYAIKDNRVIASSAVKMELKQVGFPAQLSSLAFDHSLMYGIMAVLIAIFAGLVTGVLFKDKGGSH